MTQATAELIPASENQIAEYNEFEAELAKYKKRYTGVVYDLDDEEQAKQANKDRREIGSVISKLDKVHDDIKAPLKVRTDLIDSERKRIKDQLQALQAEIKKQQEAHEAKIAAHAAELEAMVQAIYQCAENMETATAAQLSTAINIVEGFQIDESYEHRRADAALAKTDTLAKLQDLHVKRMAYEAEQAELARLRQEREQREREEREAKIRAEAEENARKQAEAAAERERALAEAKARAEAEAAQRQIEEAQRKQREAEEKAKRAAQAERERIERDQRAAAAKVEAERLAEEAKRLDEEHRAQTRSVAIISLTVEAGLAEAVAEQIITLIDEGKIANLAIEY